MEDASRPAHSCFAGRDAASCHSPLAPKAVCTRLIEYLPYVGLQRTDNNMEFTTWPQVNMINQKNYYTCVTLSTLSSRHLTSLLPSRRRIAPPPKVTCNGRTQSARRPSQGQERRLCSQYTIREEVSTAALCLSSRDAFLPRDPARLFRVPHERRILTATFHQRFPQARRSDFGIASPGR
jgi:hypothetical protein